MGSDWNVLGDEFKAAAVQFVAFVRDSKPLPVQQAVKRLGNTCLNCHEVGKGNSPPVELWKRTKTTIQLLEFFTQDETTGTDSRIPLRRCQLAAVQILGTRTSDRDKSVPAILAALETADEELARSAAEALVALGESDQTGEPALDNALKSEPIRVRFGVARHARLRKSATGACTQWLARSQPEDRLKAANWLALLGDKAADAAPALQKIQKDDPDADVRLAAGDALRKISKKAIFPALLEGLKDSDALVRGRAAQALARARRVHAANRGRGEGSRCSRLRHCRAGRIGPPRRCRGRSPRLLKADDARSQTRGRRPWPDRRHASPAQRCF